MIWSRFWARGGILWGPKVWAGAFFWRTHESEGKGAKDSNIRPSCSHWPGRGGRTKTTWPKKGGGGDAQLAFSGLQTTPPAGGAEEVVICIRWGDNKSCGATF